MAEGGTKFEIKGEDGAPLSEDQLLKALRAIGKYHIDPIRSLERVNIENPPAPDNYHGFNSYLKLSLFSGDELKGDVSYVEWRHDVSSLVGDPEVTAGRLTQTIRRSLRGTAKKMLIPMGDRATPAEI